MKILHIAAHLGGGVGKAHAALCAADGDDVQRHYLLLEEPRDRRYATAIEQAGGTITVAPDPAIAHDLVAQADVLQIEWWNHPRLYECLCRWDLPDARTVIWAHISGLHAPCIPAGLLTAPHRFLFTSACSMEAAAVQSLAPEDRAGLGVVNSGFGFATPAPVSPERVRNVGYLGTVDFSKLSPDFFEVVDRAEPDTPVSIWGDVEAGNPVLRRASAMRKPAAVRFAGHTDDPEEVLRQTGIFLYLLQPEHFGTAENALIEAMSLGCAPLVFDNPAEHAIVEHGRTGFIEADAPAAAERLKWMLRNPDMVARIGEAAARAMARTRTAAKSAGEFAAIYRDVLSLEKRKTDYNAILGSTPAEWFLSTLEDPCSPKKDAKGPARKGTLAHFAQCFPDDPSFDTLTNKAAGAETLWSAMRQQH